MNSKTKRPTSVRVATAFAGFLFLAAFAIGFQFLRADPADRSLFLAQFKDPIYAGRVALSVVCFPALIFKPRSLFTYYSTATFLALITVAMVQTALGPSITLSTTTASRPAIWLVALLTAYLFHRFSFGRPSREYFDFRISPPPLENQTPMST